MKLYSTNKSNPTMLLLKSILLLSFVIIILSDYVLSDLLLFETGWMKFHRHGQRKLFNNVEHIDPDLIEIDPKLLIIRAKYIENLYPDAIRNFQNLNDLTVIKCGVESIHAGAFRNLTNLITLQLQDNQIETINDGIFNGLPIKVLLLQRNLIETIATKAFHNMSNLVKIKLNSNKLKIWDSGWFHDLPKLELIFMRRNRIETLPNQAFSNITKVAKHLKIFLSKNKIGRQFNAKAFDDLIEIRQLWLDRNGITVLEDGVFNDLIEIDVLNLARNRIVTIGENTFRNVIKFGILDLSSNRIDTIPYRLLQHANLTNLEKTNFTCDAVEQLRKQLEHDHRQSQIVFGTNC